MSNLQFNEQEVLEHLKHYLPSQTPLKDFIHHNSLHAFQHLKFYDAIFKASKIFGYQVTLELKDFRLLYNTGRIKKDTLERAIIESKGLKNKDVWNSNLLFKVYDENNISRIGNLRNHWKEKHKIDLDARVQPLLFRVLGSYLDQGISTWNFPINSHGFLASIKEIESNGLVSFFKTSRAKMLLKKENCSITDLLKIIVGNESYFEQYLFDQQFSHRGWSGMAATIEQFPDTLLEPKKISLQEVIIFELLLEIDALDYENGQNWNPLSENIDIPPTDLFQNIEYSEQNDVFTLWQNAFEWSYYDEVLSGIILQKNKKSETDHTPSFQAFFCIDERECSLRRHIESVDTNSETFGTPGFFGVEFYFQPQNGKFYDKLCPAPLFPKYLIKESEAKSERKHELLYSKKGQNTLLSFILSIPIGILAVIRLTKNIFKPKMSPAISNAFAHVDKGSKLTIENKNETENGLQIGFTIEEMTTRVEGLLRGTGLVKNFSPIVYLIAHGSSSANNPHHGAHDCGACSGRPGSVNSRVFAFMANHPKVRENLSNKGILINQETQFIGGLHDTAADEIQFYGVDILSKNNQILHQKHLQVFDDALNLNAKERSRRFSSIKTKNSLVKVRKAIKDRSVSLFEPRPELGHGTNSLCIVGGRDLTKNLFLDRRAFLNSYNYKTDLDGKVLTGIMKPLGPVCGGINLEYYFSRVDNHKLGAGTKLPHHVMGLIGVTNSCDGDLRPGLPLQMIEVHDPVRLLIIVEHFPEVVLKTIQSVPEMYEWFINEWVHLIAINPETNMLYYFKEGIFTVYTPVLQNTNYVKNFTDLMESAKEMETNYIVDATKENLPVQLIK